MLGSILNDIFLKKPASIAPVGSDFIAPRIEQREGGSILCFTGRSEGNALAVGSEWLFEPLKKKASRVLFFDLGEPGWQKRLEKALGEPVWFAVGHFCFGQQISVFQGEQEGNLWEAAGVPFLRIFPDIPAYFPDSHVANFRNSINAYCDISHANFYRRWFPNPALSLVLPPLYVLDPIPLEEVDRESKLKGPIIFPKNGNSPDKLIDYWRNSLPAFLAEILVNTAEESISRNWINREPCFDEQVIEQFDRLGIDISAKPTILCFLVAQLDDYVRRVKSTMIAKAIMDLPVMIRGVNWEHLNFEGKRVTYVKDSDVTKTQALLGQALAVIDMSPNTQHSAHDRITRATGRGTAFLTNKQVLWSDLIPENERFSFDFEPAAIRALVENYVLYPREAVELGMEQSRILRAANGEEGYVKTLLTAVDACAFQMQGRPEGTQNFVAFPHASYG